MYKRHSLSFSENPESIGDTKTKSWFLASIASLFSFCFFSLKVFIYVEFSSPDSDFR